MERNHILRDQYYPTHHSSIWYRDIYTIPWLAPWREIFSHGSLVLYCWSSFILYMCIRHLITIFILCILCYYNVVVWLFILTYCSQMLVLWLCIDWYLLVVAKHWNICIVGIWFICLRPNVEVYLYVLIFLYLIL